MIKLDIKGDLDKLGIDKGIQKSLVQSTQLVRGSAIENAPFQTGNLRRSITTKIEPRTGIVGTNVVYARVREYVNKKNPNRRFYMRRALQDNAEKILKIFANNVDQSLDK